MNQMEKTTSLVTGNIKKQLLLFSIPIFMSTLLQQLYNIIDAIVAGRLLTDNSISAIGVAVPIYLLFVSVILGLAIGVSILLAQFYGAKKYDEIKALTSTVNVIKLSPRPRRLGPHFPGLALNGGGLFALTC